MQGSLVQVAIDRRREEDHGCSLARRHLQVHGGKVSLSSLRAIVEIHQHRYNPLATILSKPPSVFVAQIECVKVLWENKCKTLVLAGVFLQARFVKKTFKNRCATQNRTKDVRTCRYCWVGRYRPTCGSSQCPIGFEVSAETFLM